MRDHKGGRQREGSGVGSRGTRGSGLKVIAGWVHEKVSVQVLKLVSKLGVIWIVGVVRIRWRILMAL